MEKKMRTMITLLMSNGRARAAASFEVDLKWCALSPENAEKIRGFSPRYLYDFTLSDPTGHYRFYTIMPRGNKGRPQRRGSRLATKRRRTIAKRSF